LNKSDGNVDNEHIRQGVKSMQEKGISVGLFLMFGAPGETIETICETYRLVKEIKPTDAFCSVLRIYPGTTVCHRAIQEGRFDEAQWIDRLGQPVFFYPQGDDYYCAKAACEMFIEHFSSEDIRQHSEQSVDGEVVTTNRIELEKIAQWKSNLAKRVLEK
jgi:radical SAM superfamily enzyme YgiQ (UPF0313 family)